MPVKLFRDTRGDLKVFYGKPCATGLMSLLSFVSIQDVLGYTCVDWILKYTLSVLMFTDTVLHSLED
jgi:hypothetical protein